MKLTPEALKQVNQLALLAQHHEQLAQLSRDALFKVVADEAGVALQNGDWHLDTDTGEITHVTTD